MTTCVLCEQPAVAVLGDWEVCEAHYNSLASPDPEPVCDQCGAPLTQDDIDAGETTCLDCAAAELVPEIDLTSPLLATVSARLAAVCVSCGGPIPPAEAARGERICAACCPLKVDIRVSPDDPLSAAVYIGPARC